MTPSPEVRKLIKRAKACYIQVRFGTSERWVRIPKIEAYALIQSSWSEETTAEIDGVGDLYLH